jgi:hypothetical protein
MSGDVTTRHSGRPLSDPGRARCVAWRAAVAVAVVCALAVGAPPRIASAGARERYVVAAAPDASGARARAVADALAARGLVVVEGKREVSPLVAAQPAAAAAVADAIRQAGDRYLEAGYDRGIAALEAVEAADLVVLLANKAGRALLVELNLWIGALHLAAGRQAAAETRFALALAVEDGARLDPAFWPPAYVAIFDRVRKRSGAIGTLVVDSVPPGARVEVNGVLAADPTPATLRLAAGDHYVAVFRAGRTRFAARQAVVAGSVDTLRIELGRADSVALAADAAVAMSDWFAHDPTLAVTVVAEATGASRVVVVTGDGVALYDAHGKPLAEARGADARQAVAALLNPATPLGVGADGAADQPWCRACRTWWFWTAVGAVAVAGSVGLYFAVREDDTLRGRVVLP